MVISEAWAREKPVIATKVGGIPYRIKDGVNGILVNPSDPKALAEAMQKLADDDKTAQEMGKNGRKNVYIWKEIAVRSIELYGQVVRNK
jgi:glycosyltransferase involved in cell wall biosynthesis